MEGLIPEMWKWAIQRVESLPPISVANLLALLIAAAFILLVLRAAWRKDSGYIPDQPSKQPEPMSPLEAAPTMMEYLFKIQHDQDEILKMLKAPDGGSLIWRINENLIQLNRLLRSREAARRRKG